MPTQRTCSACKQKGHTKRSKLCPRKQPIESSVAQPAATAPEPIATALEPIATAPDPIPKPILTEDLGKIFEKAICDMFGIPYEGVYKYTKHEHELKHIKIISKIGILKNLVPPGQIKHTAEKGARYDFTFTDTKTGEIKNWSAKTTKRDGKVAPQIIGQPSLTRFCELVGCGELSIPELKQYIQSPDKIPLILQLMYGYTFSCPVVYYNEARDDIKYIIPKIPINWQELKFEWTRSHEFWTNSSTLKVIKPGLSTSISLVEFQFHTKRRNMAIRWCFENLLSLFGSKFEIIQIYQKTSINPNIATSVVEANTTNPILAPIKKKETQTEFQPKRKLQPKRLLIMGLSG